jgi:hypothetical protein
MPCTFPEVVSTRVVFMFLAPLVYIHHYTWSLFLHLLPLLIKGIARRFEAVLTDGITVEISEEPLGDLP